MLIAATSTSSVVAVGIAVVGVLALITSAVIVVVGTRNKTVATQQDQSIAALSGELEAAKFRIDNLESDNRALKVQVAEDRGAINALKEVASSQGMIRRGFEHLGVPAEVLK